MVGTNYYGWFGNERWDWWTVARFLVADWCGNGLEVSSCRIGLQFRLTEGKIKNLTLFSNFLPKPRNPSLHFNSNFGFIFLSITWKNVSTRFRDVERKWSRFHHQANRFINNHRKVQRSPRRQFDATPVKQTPLFRHLIQRAHHQCWFALISYQNRFRVK